MRGLVAAALLACGCNLWGDEDHTGHAERLTGGDPHRGKVAILRHGCGACHAIPDVPGAHATVGPALNGLPGRATLAGDMPNSATNLIRWIRHPQRIKPGNVMPDMDIPDHEARDIAAYLYTLD